MTQELKIIHVDMDAFYASVEQHDNPALAGKAVIVGGDIKRGVVSAASYEARKFGVHSAMPMARAVKLCPDAVVVAVRMQRYHEVSDQIQAIFRRFTPDIEPLSLDEAFLDVGGSVQLFGSAEEIGRQIKDMIKNETGLTASVGIAPNKFLAKIASDLQKPDGFVVITEENKQQVLDGLGVSRMWGIGKVTEQKLRSREINTIKQLREAPAALLKSVFGGQTDHILELASGHDSRRVESQREAKSISSEETFADDVADRDFLVGVLTGQVEDVAGRLRATGLEARTITLKLRYANFKTVSRSQTFDTATNVTDDLLKAAKTVFLQWQVQSGGALRLLGFGVSALHRQGTGQQMLFKEQPSDKQKKLDNAVDKIRNKFGDDALRRGR